MTTIESSELCKVTKSHGSGSANTRNMNDSSKRFKIPFKKLRFSLRTLGVATAIVAIACYWLVLPTINAQRFVRDVKCENYERADTYFRNLDDRFLLAWNEKYWRLYARASLEPWSFAELLRGRRLVRMHLTFGDATLRSREWLIAATRIGLLQPQLTMLSHGGGGGMAI